jgi:protein gp37
MSANSKIEWTDHTFNPWTGCTKVSPGCVNCYAEARDNRFAGGKHWGKGAPRRRTGAANWRQVNRWNRTAICTNCGYAELIGSDDCRKCRRNFSDERRRRPRVFCASLADWLDEEVPIEWLADFLALIHDTLNLDWLLLTKRPENWRPRLQAVEDFLIESDESYEWVADWLGGGPSPETPDNVWLGVSVEDQKRADERIPILLNTPARIRFLSCEPLLEPIDLKLDWNNDLARWDSTGRELPPRRIDWVIIGGESGPKARPCDVEWVRDIVNQCRAARVPVFVKQLGRKIIDKPPGQDPHFMRGKVTWYRTFRDRKGGDPAEWPEDLRVREFPTVVAGVSPASV